MSDPRERLQRLSERSKELLEDLDCSRQDLLSVADLNRAIKQVLRNQIAILDRLATGGRAPARTAPAQEQPQTPRISLRARPSDGTKPGDGTQEGGLSGERPPGGFEPLVHAEEADDPRDRDLDAVDPLDAAELDSIVNELAGRNGRRLRPAPQEAHHREIAVEALAEQVLQEKRILSKAQARVFIEQFDNRDKDYEKGLHKLNRWLEGGTSGTPFQLRGDRAYLNLQGGSPTWLRKNEEQLMTRMGFSRRIGRLDAPGLTGEIVVYERP